MSKMHIKTGDTVVVINGADSNRKDKAIGKVIGVSPKEGKCIVEGVHVVSKHARARRQGETGGIIKTEGAIYASKVMLYCPKCQAGRRVHIKVSENGEKIRSCCKCGETL